MEIKTQDGKHFMSDHKIPHCFATRFENCILDYWKRIGHKKGSPEINNCSCKFSEYPGMKWARELTITKVKIKKLPICEINLYHFHY